MRKKRGMRKKALLQTPYTTPIGKQSELPGRRTGAVRAPMDRVTVPLDKVEVPLDKVSPTT